MPVPEIQVIHEDGKASYEHDAQEARNHAEEADNKPDQKIDTIGFQYAVPSSNSICFIPGTRQSMGTRDHEYECLDLAGLMLPSAAGAATK